MLSLWDKRKSSFSGLDKYVADVKKKMNDLNARDLDQACRIIAGTARSSGITVED